MQKRIRFVALFLSLIAVLAACETETATRVSDDNSPGTKDQAPKVFSITDTIQLGNFRLKIHKFENPMRPVDEFSQPAKGNKYVAVDMEITNTSNETQAFSIVLSVEIKNAANQSFDVDLASGGRKPSAPDGEIAAKDSSRGWVVFEVPQANDKYRLVFKGDIFATGQAVVQLN